MTQDNFRHLYNVIGVLMMMLGIALGIAAFKMWYGLW
jgi:hypothetical protein